MKIWQYLENMALNSHITLEYRTTNDCLIIRNSIFCLGAEFSSETVQSRIKILHLSESRNFNKSIYVNI